MPSLHQIRSQISESIVQQLQAAVSRACVESISKEVEFGGLETLMVSMLASAIATHGDAEEMRHLARYSSDLLIKVIDQIADEQKDPIANIGSFQVP